MRLQAAGASGHGNDSRRLIVEVSGLDGRQLSAETNYTFELAVYEH